MKKTFIRIVTGILGVFVIAQLFRPELTNPQSDPALSVKNYKGILPEVVAKIEKACYDCHSNETHWPWYSYVTPINYLIAGDANNGRKRVNFSEWGKYKPGKLQSVLDNIYDEVYHRSMPLKKYSLIHAEARLTDAEVKMICDWASAEQDRLAQEADMQTEKNEQQETSHDSTRAKK
jgi:hypothetical protein